MELTPEGKTHRGGGASVDSKSNDAPVRLHLRRPCPVALTQEEPRGREVLRSNQLLGLCHRRERPLKCRVLLGSRL